MCNFGLNSGKTVRQEGLGLQTYRRASNRSPAMWKLASAKRCTVGLCSSPTPGSTAEAPLMQRQRHVDVRIGLGLRVRVALRRHFICVYQR